MKEEKFYKMEAVVCCKYTGPNQHQRREGAKQLDFRWVALHLRQQIGKYEPSERGEGKDWKDHAALREIRTDGWQDDCLGRFSTANASRTDE